MAVIDGDLGYDDECGGGEDEDKENEEDTEPADDDTSNGVLDRDPSSSSACQGGADCFTGMITEIVDGDTLTR